jgi:hypothetical protein
VAGRRPSPLSGRSPGLQEVGTSHSPTVRATINVNTLIAGFAPTHGAILTAVSGQGFTAEQTLFAPNDRALSSTPGLAQ